MKYEIKPGANLEEANLEEADLSKANLFLANLKGADLEDILYNDLTQCSEGSILDNYIKKKSIKI